MARVSRKDGSMYRERIQLKAGTVVLVVREDERLKPMLGWVMKAILDNGAINYRVKLFDSPKAQRYPMANVIPVVGWAISPDDKTRYHFVRIKRDPVTGVKEAEVEGTQEAAAD